MNVDIDFSNLVVTLSWLAGPGGTVAWFIFVSDTIRNARAKGGLAFLKTALELQLFVAACSVALPALAFAILRFVPAETLEAAQPYFAFASMLVAGYFTQRIWYRVNKLDKAIG